MKKSVLVLVIVLAFLALSAPVFSDVSTGDVFQLWSNKLFGGMTGNPFTNWYEVADWEVKVCFDWGGERDPNQVFGDTLQGDIYHDTVIAIQAGADNPLPEEFANHVGERLYEVSWFVQPTQTDEDMNFEVFLVDALGGKKVIGSGNSNYVNGFRDYFVEYSSANYTKASIHYWNLRDDEWREVPVVG